MNTNVPSPAAILKEALRSVPQVKWALAVAGIIAIIAIVVGGWKINPMIAVFGTVVMLVLMVVFVIFARLSTATTIEFRWAVQVFMWASLCLTIAAAGLLFTSVFFSWPLHFQTGATDRAEAAGYKPSDGDRKVWALEDEVNTLRGQWETVSYFGTGKISEEVLEQATKLGEALLSVEDGRLGPSGYVIKREYACYAFIMAATTEPKMERRIEFSNQAVDLCREALNYHEYVQANKTRNGNLRYVATWATRVDEQPFTAYLLAIASCVQAVSDNNDAGKRKANDILNVVPSYYLDRYPPSRDWVLKQCSEDSTEKEAKK
jgi:hypothetical protein